MKPRLPAVRIGHLIAFALLPAALLTVAPAPAQRVPIGKGSVVKTIVTLRPGQYVWAPQAAPSGPLLMIVNVTSQRALLFRNGVPIGASTVSTGRPGHSTPTGVFSVLQKKVEHYSSKYNNAPMPYMQRLTWAGVALHAGNLPGYPASHGCIRLPRGFAKLLFGVSNLGMTVVITDSRRMPRLAPTPQIVALGETGAASQPPQYQWDPQKSPEGPISIVVSATDQRAVVLRNGVEIGAARVTIDGPVSGTWAYMLRNVDESGQHWIRIDLAADSETGQPVEPEEWRRFHAPDGFRTAIAQIVRPGTTVLVTADSLVAGATATPLTVIDSEPGKP